MNRVNKLTESDLNRIIKESVNKVLNEGMFGIGDGKVDKYMSSQNKLRCIGLIKDAIVDGKTEEALRMLDTLANLIDKR